MHAVFPLRRGRRQTPRRSFSQTQTRRARARARVSESAREAAASRYTSGTNTMLVYKPKGVIEYSPASYLSIWLDGIVDEPRGSSLCISSSRAVAVADTCSREKAEDENAGISAGYFHSCEQKKPFSLALRRHARTHTRRGDLFSRNDN